MSLKILGPIHNAPDTIHLAHKDVPSAPAWKFRLHSWASVNAIVSISSSIFIYLASGHEPRFVRGQSIRQRPAGTDTQNSRFGGVPRAWWYSAAVRS